MIGFAVAWLLGVYSNTLGPGQIPVSIADWVIGGAAIFGCVGAALGSSVGTLLGNVIAALFAFERGESADVPRWLVAVVIAGAVLFGIWFASGPS